MGVLFNSKVRLTCAEELDPSYCQCIGTPCALAISLLSTSPAQRCLTCPTLNVLVPPCIGNINQFPIPSPNSPIQMSSARLAPNVPPPPGLKQAIYLLLGISTRASRFVTDISVAFQLWANRCPTLCFGGTCCPSTCNQYSNWFSQHRHSTRPSQTHASLWGEINGPDFGIEA